MIYTSRFPRWLQTVIYPGNVVPVWCLVPAEWLEATEGHAHQRRTQRRALEGRSSNDPAHAPATAPDLIEPR